MGAPRSRNELCRMSATCGPWPAGRWLSRSSLADCPSMLDVSVRRGRALREPGPSASGGRGGARVCRRREPGVLPRRRAHAVLRPPTTPRSPRAPCSRCRRTSRPRLSPSAPHHFLIGYTEVVRPMADVMGEAMKYVCKAAPIAGSGVLGGLGPAIAKVPAAGGADDLTRRRRRRKMFEVQRTSNKEYSCLSTSTTRTSPGMS